MYRIFLQCCCSCIVKCFKKQYRPNKPSLFTCKSAVNQLPPDNILPTLILLKDRKDSSTDAACLLPNGIILLIPCSQIWCLLQKNNNNSNNIKGEGGWRAGEEKNGRDGECVLRTACHHPLLMAKKSVFMLTVIEYSCSLVFKNYTQKYRSPSDWESERRDLFVILLCAKSRQISICC